MEILLLIFAMIILGLLWSFPLYVIVNFVLWLFHAPFYITMWQALGICLLLSVIGGILFKDKGE